MLPFEYQEHFSDSENLLQVFGQKESSSNIEWGSGTPYIKERSSLAAVSAWLGWYTPYWET